MDIILEVFKSERKGTNERRETSCCGEKRV